MAPRAAMAVLGLKELNRATLARQMLLARAAISPLAAIEKLCGLQAQVPRPPFGGLWTRVEGFEREDLRRLLHERAAVRATSMRGTLHLMSAADFLALRAALQPGLTQGMKSVLRDRAKSLDIPALVAEAEAFFAARPSTFEALRDHLLGRFPQGDERAMGFAVRTHLPLVMVPTDDPWAFPANADFAVASRWLGRELAADSKPHALVRRYLAAFGPATPGDAQAWSGLSGLREVFEELRPELVTFQDERKRELFDLPDAPRPPAETPAPVRFLPEFDNLVLSHDDRRRVIADEHRGAVVSKNLQVRATFLLDGVVAGTWKVERKKTSATLLVEPFAPLPKKARGELEEEGARLLAFLEADAKTHAIALPKR